MDRLQKKCFIASAGFHLLLGCILLVGPAFLSSSSKSDNTPILDVVPPNVIDAAFNNGNPNAKPPPPLPLVKQPLAVAQPQPPAPQPEVKPQPEPEREVVHEPQPDRQEKPDPDSLETSTEKKKLPKVSLTEVVRPASKKQQKPNSTVDPQEQQLAYRRQKAAQLLGSAAITLKEDMSSAVSLDSDFGAQGSGPAYASYDQVVRSIYWHAWVAPDDTATDDAIVKATVTIARDGNVLSARILRASGDSGVDRSVQRTLERVTFVHECPEGAKEKERTYTINFNLKAKRLSG